MRKDGPEVGTEKEKGEEGMPGSRLWGWSFFPFFGYIAVLFYGAFCIDRLKEGRKHTFVFMLFCLILLSAVGCCALVPVFVLAYPEEVSAGWLTAVLAAGYLAFALSALLCWLVFVRYYAALYEKKARRGLL